MVEQNLITVRFRWKHFDWIVTLQVDEMDEDITDVVFVECAALDLSGNLVNNTIAKELAMSDRPDFIKRSVGMLERRTSE